MKLLHLYAAVRYNFQTLEKSYSLYMHHHHHSTIFLILLEHIFCSSDALVLIKFKRITGHYMKHRESSATHDPLDDYGLEKRIQLCDDVLNAKQFSTKYPLWHMKKVSTEPLFNSTKWNLPSGVPIDTLNYQRSLSARQGGKDSPALQYKKYSQRVRGSTKTIRIKKLPCVRTATIRWFVTFGLAEGFMYLIECDHGKKHLRPRLVAILEPGPFLDNPGFTYFQSQHEEYRDEMESICLLGFDDHMRLCATVLDTLDKLGKLTITISQTIHVKYKDQHCVQKDINMNGKVSREYFLQCDLLFDDGSESSSLFYALADSNERGAVFVFLEGEHGTLELYARMVKIGALVNPVGPNEVQLNAETQFRNGKGRIIGNHNFVTWREVRALKNKKERFRYHGRPAGNSKRRSRSELQSGETRHTFPSKNERELEDETESGYQDDHVLQKSKGSASGKKRHLRYIVKNKDLIEDRATKKGKQKYEKNEYHRDGLEKVSDSSEEEEEYGQASEERTQVFEGRSERKDRELLELQMLVRTFAEHIEKDRTNKSEISPLLTNPPESWGRRAKRS